MYNQINPQKHPLFKKGLLTTPLLENNAAFLLRLLHYAGMPNFKGFEPWGPGKYGVCMTHDVDGPRLLTLFSMLRSFLFGSFRRDTYELSSFFHGLPALF
ncbi:MAG: hypothetical protein C4522_22145 [Desulfobacteraceae bacterium]|nr:MAG: hypothetical protein C4522_22145 [Desulfobacteraceae bacterium]